MSAERPQDDRHARIRSDHATELAEDYVEAIDDIVREAGTCRVKDLATCFRVTHVTVNRTLGRLSRDGYVETEPYGPVGLTQKGKRLAAKSRERHKIVLEFLLALGITQRTAEIDAEGIEHHVSNETLAVMKRFVRE